MDAGATIAVRLALLSLAMSPLIGWAAIRRWGAPSWLTPPRMRLLFLALVTLGVVHLVWHVTTSVTTDIGIGRDALWYWGVDLDDPYRATYLNQELFPYSPAAALLFAPFTSLSWPAFLALWCSINLGVVAWLTRRDMLVWILFPPLVWLLVIGNIEVLIGFAVVLGFRWPWMWAFIVLTKVTPGIGLLWFAVRREWRSLGIALGSIVLVIAGSWLVVPDLWPAWFSFLGSGQDAAGWIPVWFRLPFAAVLVTWGALTDRKWTVLVAVMVSVPHFWFASMGGLVALAALERRPEPATDRGAIWTSPIAQPAAEG